MSNRTRRKSLCKRCRSGRHAECQNPGGCKCRVCAKAAKKDLNRELMEERRLSAEEAAEEAAYNREHPPEPWRASITRRALDEGSDLGGEYLDVAPTAEDGLEDDDEDDEDLDDDGEEEEEDWDEEDEHPF